MGSVGSEGAVPESGIKETLIKSLSDFTLEFLCIARNNLTRIASYLRRGSTSFESFPRMRNKGGGALRRFCKWQCPKEAFQSLATNP